MSRFFAGAAYLFRALAFVRSHARLWGWVVAPATLTAAVAGTLGWEAWHWAHALVDRYTVGHGAFVAAVVDVLLFILAVGVFYVGFLVVSVVACAPFAGILSERTEKLATGRVVAPTGARALGAMLRSTVHVMWSLFIYLAIAAPLFLAHFFVPPLAPFTIVANLLLTAVFLAYDAWDLPLSRRDLAFRAKWATLKRHQAESLGLGLAAAALLAVPGFNLIVPPLAAVAGTLMFVELERAALDGA
jgi:CysZ protein